MNVARGVLKRIGLGLITLWGVSVITFILMFVVPADPAAMIAGENTNEETLKNIRAKYGLDQPAPVQYARFMSEIATGNLESYKTKENVFGAILNRFPNTLLLAMAGLAIWMLVSIPLGMVTAKYAGTPFDRLALILTLLAISIPAFLLGRILQRYLGYELGWFSVGGDASLWNLPLPALTLGIGGAAYYSRLLHSNLRGVLKENYVRAARARGLAENVVMRKHALKNALIPLITILGMDIASLLSGLIFTEKVFGWPGIGSLMVDAIPNQDRPMIMGTVLFASLMVVTMNIVVDFAYRIIDPRVRID
jgi:peptide/nickel transport system permease protein